MGGNNNAMFGVSNKSRTIGVDIGESSIKLVQILRSGKAYTVEHVAIEPLDRSLFIERRILDAEQVGSIIYRMLSGNGFTAKQAVTCVSYSDVISKQLWVRADLKPRELEQWIDFEVDKFVPFPVADLYIDYQSIGERTEDGKREVQVVACRKLTVENLSSCLDAAHLTPVAVDVNPHALVRVARQMDRADANSEKLGLIVDVGLSSTRFYVYSGNSLVYQRDEPQGGAILINDIMSEHSLEEEEAHRASYRNNFFTDARDKNIKPYVDWLSAEIESAISIFENTRKLGSISSVFLAGGPAQIKDIDKILHKHVRLDVKLLNLFEAPDVNLATYLTDVWVQAPQLAVACGLAMWEPE